MKSLLGDEFADFEESILSHDNVRALRVNTKKISVSKFRKISPYNLEKILYNDDGFYLGEDVKMGGEVCHQAGMFYMQEPSAMIPVDSISICPTWRVLDVCAAPGGKTCQISNRLSDKGLLISNDIKFERCKALIENVERLGLTNTILISDSIDSLCLNFSSFFDMVLVDATCSGEGMFRKNQNIMTYWSEKKVRNCVEIQKNILDSVVSVLKCEGYIVYSTCTYSTEENEEVIDYFLDKHTEFCLVPVESKIIPYTSAGITINNKYDFSLTRRFYPHKGIGEGQFVAVLHKKQGNDVEYVNEVKDKTKETDRDAVLVCLKELGVNVSSNRIMVKGNNIWILPDVAIRIKKHVLRQGVYMGELQNGTIVLAHSFFMAFGNEMNNQVELPLESQVLKSYLRGEDISSCAKDGWGVITVDGCAIGGFYAKNGYLQNYYPKYLTNKDIFD